MKLLQQKKKRRHLQSDYSADVSVTSNIPVPSNKSAFQSIPNKNAFQRNK